MYFQRLEDLRIDADKTQEEIAAVLHCKREVYRRYEKGIHELPVWALVELAVLLAAVVLLAFLSRRASAPAAALLLPYILWVLYAGYLCWGVFTLS